MRNKLTFAVGTTGRDMLYTFMSTYLIVYLTTVLKLSPWVLAWVAGLMLVTRLFDAVLDIVMGSIVDNTRTRWGHYKPWILGGVIASAVFTSLLVIDSGLTDAAFIIVFWLTYLCWSLSWTTNDIPYWSLLPALSLDQKQREQIGSLAKIFATIGQFSVVVAIVPVTSALTPGIGERGAWFVFVAAILVIMLIGQMITLVGTKVPDLVVVQPRITVKELFAVVFHNDQLLWTAVAMILFMTGYTTTIQFGMYFFQYAFHNTDMYAPFGAVLGIASLAGYLVFPVARRRLNRRTLYTLASASILVGYVVFFFAPMNIVIIGVAGLFLFFGQAFITVLMLVFLTDTVDYGHWKLGHRNTAATFALQPFVNKVGAALATEIVAIAVIMAGIPAAVQANSDTLSPQGLLIMKTAMLGLPLVLIAVGYVIYRTKYRIDEAFFAQIQADLRQRGQLVDSAGG